MKSPAVLAAAGPTQWRTAVVVLGFTAWPVLLAWVASARLKLLHRGADDQGLCHLNSAQPVPFATPPPTADVVAPGGDTVYQCPPLPNISFADDKTDPLSGLHLVMGINDKKVFFNTLRMFHGGSYLEWGSGGSTGIVPYIMRKVVSIENAVGWCQQMQQREMIVTATQLGILELKCVDTGELTGYFARPTKGANVSKISEMYLEAADHTSHKGPFDVVLVDGRFRVACALKAIRSNLIDRHSVLMIHDYTIRKSYKAVEEFYDVLEIERGGMGIGTIVALRKKETINVERLEEVFKKYAQIWL